MARSRGLVPSFERLGLRIAPSNMAPVAAAETSGVGPSIVNTITWILPEDRMRRDLSECERIVASVDWILPPTTISE